MNTNSIDKEILRINDSICRHIKNLDRDGRGYVAQDVVADLRHLVDHVSLKIYASNQHADLTPSYPNICDARDYIAKTAKYKRVRKFYLFLEMVVSHYKPDPENSERLMLKYYDYLFDLRQVLKNDYGFEILQNLEDFPLDLDPKLQEYYEKIAVEVERFQVVPDCTKGSRFYIEKIKPFYVNGSRYFEVTFSEATDKLIKTDRLIAFSKIPIMDNYASKMLIVPSEISIMSKKMPVNIIVGWEVAIRNCEFRNFCKIFSGVNNDIGGSETRFICKLMTIRKWDLLDIINLTDESFNSLKNKAMERAQVTIFLSALERARKIITRHLPGENIIKLLLFSMNNNLIKSQYYSEKNPYFSLYLKMGCRPFDNIPYNFSPVDHNIRFSDLISCIDYHDKVDQLLARHIKNNAEVNGVLFTPIKELEGYGDVVSLANAYKSRLYWKHKPQAEIRINHGYAFIYSYVEDCNYIVDRLNKLAVNGIQNYKVAVESWLNNEDSGFYSEEKKEILKNMFSQSRVGVLYGAAGTGKSTYIKLLSSYFSDKDKLFLAQTHPAVDNLKRKVNLANCDFSTVSKFTKNSRVKTEYDILIIDECSTVSNENMRKILEKASFKLLLLVGDTYQIASIRFGNWFDIVRKFIPQVAVNELAIPYRSDDEKLLELWRRVRSMEDSVTELISRPDFSSRLDESVFEKKEKDEIILCLNYDGLYGINNLNRFLQENNEEEAYEWGLQCYKVGDPILFNDSERFSPIIYNNMKGTIRRIRKTDSRDEGEKITFDIELDKVLDGMDIYGTDIEIIEDYDCLNTVVRFSVFKRRSVDDDDDSTSNTIVPFQIAYAVSIHKAQGLEYDSVKVVITNEVDEMITHNIFYTAITRAKKRLKIYWSPEVQSRLLSDLAPRNNGRDISLLRTVSLE